MYVLEFEKPVRDLENQLQRTREAFERGDKGVSQKTIDQLEKQVGKLKKELYSKLTNWQRVQISRHPARPYTLDYVAHMTTDFVELHGDRAIKDDKALVGGLARLDGLPVMVIGHQKGRNTKERQYRNFGMANPDGYRKALRLMKTAEKFGKPVICFIDTPGASPGMEAEERGQGEAIARNLQVMARLRTPIVCIIIGEGASGGALGIGVGDRVLMLENTWYSVISPESCSSILWRSWDYKEQAAEALQLSSMDMLHHQLIDGIIGEPMGGAHYDPAYTFAQVKEALLQHLSELREWDTETLLQKRMDKLAQMSLSALKG
jgi:acetyl-CoA carboxylase carboxyl transferase subunit alpha